MNAVVLLLLAQLDPEPWLPPESDVGRFPSGAVAREQVLRYRQHLAWATWMAERPVLDLRYGADYWYAVRAVTIERMDCWELLAWANCNGEVRRRWGVPVRVHLDQLRSRLGDFDYACGRMPPMLPAGLPRAVEVMPSVPVPGNNHR